MDAIECDQCNDRRKLLDGEEDLWRDESFPRRMSPRIVQREVVGRRRHEVRWWEPSCLHKGAVSRESLARLETSENSAWWRRRKKVGWAGSRDGVREARALAVCALPRKLRVTEILQSEQLNDQMSEYRIPGTVLTTLYVFSYLSYFTSQS